MSSSADISGHAARDGGSYNCQRPRRLLDLLRPRTLCALIAALPPPRLRFVPLGFFPELRLSPGRLPGRAPDFVRAPRLSLFGRTSTDLFLWDIAGLNVFSFFGRPFVCLCANSICFASFRDPP